MSAPVGPSPDSESKDKVIAIPGAVTEGVGQGAAAGKEAVVNVAAGAAKVTGDAANIAGKGAKGLKGGLIGEQGQWQFYRNSSKFQGWEDFDPETNEKMEKAFQSGKSHFLIKAGRKDVSPRELFFIDNKQYNPSKGTMRDIRRLGADGFANKVARWTQQFVKYLETGESQRVTFKQFIADKKARAAKKGKKDGDTVDMFSEYWQSDEWIFAWMARHGLFITITGLMIVFNTIWLGIDAENNSADTLSQADPIFQLVENIFCTFFFCELIIIFLAFKNKRDCLSNFWFLFDACLVFLYVGEVWIMRIVEEAGGKSSKMKGGSILRFAKALRLARLGRISRLLRMLPGAISVIKGLLKALAASMFTFVMLLITMYLFGVCILQLAKENDVLQETFPSLSNTMYKLAIQGCLLDDLTGLMDDMKDNDLVIATIFGIFIVLANMTLLNMLIGLLAEVVSETNSQDAEEVACSELRRRIGEVLECHDTHGDQAIDQAEFDLMLSNPTMIQTLAEYDVDIRLVETLRELLFEEKPSGMAEPVEGMTDEQEEEDARGPGMMGGDYTGKMSFDSFLDALIDLRSGNGAGVKDIIELKKTVMKGFDDLKRHYQGEGVLRHTASGSVAPGPPVDKMDRILQLLESQDVRLNTMQAEMSIMQKNQEMLMARAG
eukprot:TRINITY_DN4751_c0_g1_i1.p1 TRINITY_DN4751_c0_g1~~TRINITY_DN4751_c0_g1_i1.p1  ORF type:complete len:663 (+),score=205.51 TRINITY_DN4751_c0_g1_i1:64-2052(+)